MDATKIFHLNQLRDDGILTEKEHAAAVERVQPTADQDRVVAMLDELHNAAIIYDDEVQVFKDRVLNAHLKPKK